MQQPTRQWISSGSPFERDAAYSRAVVDGDTAYVSGTTGFDYRTMTLADDVVAQCRQTFENLAAALAEADMTLDDVVRVTYILPDPDAFPKCWPVLRERFGAARPAATMFAARLIDPRLKIEIEVTARRRNGA
ncbi:MAG: RidA family protein [Planctomycetota bacterium]